MGDVRDPWRPGDDSSPAAGPAVLEAATIPAPVSRAEPPSRLPRAVERLLDGTVLALALWTVVYHVCLVLQWDVWAALLLTLLGASGVLVVSRRLRGHSRSPAEPRRLVAPASDVGSPVWQRPLVLPTAVAALVAALAFALEVPWALVVATWLVAAGLGVVVAWRALAGWAPDAERSAAPDANGSVTSVARRDRRSFAVALTWGLALAGISVAIARSNPDDIFYVNLSQWVAEHGSFPLRDTIYGNLDFSMTSWPPMASYDALVGTVAHVLHVRAATVVYEAVPPLVAVLSVLTMWQLLRRWRVAAVSLALSAAMLFLVFDGAAPYSPGNLLLTRLWQGKVIFLALIVPLLFDYAARHNAKPSRSTLARLALGGIAAVGVSTSAMFLTPVLAVASMAPLVRSRPRDALQGFAAMAAYPLAAAGVTTALHGHSADDFEREIYRFAPSWFGPEVFNHGLIAFLAVGAVLAMAILLPNRSARLTVAILALFVGVTLIPGVTRLSFDLVGLGPTLWRLTWLTPVALSVGVVVARLVMTLSTKPLRVVAVVVALAVAAVLCRPVWSYGSTSWAWPFHAQRPADSVEATDRLIKVLEPGDTVLAEQSLSITISVFTTQITTVSPRDYFVDYLRGEPGFHAGARVRLSTFVASDSVTWSRRLVSHDLNLLSVDAVCMDTVDDYGAPRSKRWVNSRLSMLSSDGFSASVRAETYVCVQR